MADPPETKPKGLERDGSLLATLKRTGTEFVEDGMTDWAAALTYYGLLSLFPMLIALVSIVGLFANPEATTEKLTEIVSNLGPDAATSTFSGPVEKLTSNRAPRESRSWLAWPWRSGPPPGTSAPSDAPRT